MYKFEIPPLEVPQDDSLRDIKCHKCNSWMKRYYHTHIICRACQAMNLIKNKTEEEEE